MLTITQYLSPEHQDKLEKLREKYRDLGACDTEPDEVWNRIVNNALEGRPFPFDQMDGMMFGLYTHGAFRDRADSAADEMYDFAQEIHADLTGVALTEEGKLPEPQRSKHRGNEIYSYDGTTWFYSSDDMRVAEDPERACGFCNLPNHPEGFDACLGELPGVWSACCGHGGSCAPHIHFRGDVLEGDVARERQKQMVRMRDSIPFNLKGDILVQVTPEGWEHYDNYQAERKERGDTPEPRPEEDPKGWSRWYAHGFFRIFGPKMINGGPYHFNANIRFLPDTGN
jgi:hypothetical protein